MKTTMRHTALAIMAALLPMMTACIKDDVATQQADKVDLTLHFSTRADNTSPLETQGGEGIKTLRVIISESDNRNVVANIYRDYSSENPLSDSKTLNILGIKQGKRNFYVIINEKSIGMETYLGNIAEGNPLPDDFETKEVINTSGGITPDKTADPSSTVTGLTFFPKRWVNVYNNGNGLGIPATGMKKDVDLVAEASTPQTVEIKCTPAVAKLTIDLDNTQMTEEYIVREVRLGQFLTDRTSLFPDQTSVTSPRTYWTENFQYWRDDYRVEAGKMYENYFTLYLFETESINNASFTLALHSISRPELATAKVFLPADITRISRGEYVKIAAKVNIHSDVEVDFSYQVLPWGAVDVEVPPFE